MLALFHITNFITLISILFNFFYSLLFIFFLSLMSMLQELYFFYVVILMNQMFTQRLFGFLFFFSSYFFHCCQCSKSYISFMSVVLMNRMFTQKNSFFVSPIIFFLHLSFNFFSYNLIYSSLCFDDTIYTFLFSLLFCLNLWMIHR